MATFPDSTDRWGIEYRVSKESLETLGVLEELRFAQEIGGEKRKLPDSEGCFTGDPDSDVPMGFKEPYIVFRERVENREEIEDNIRDFNIDSLIEEAEKNNPSGLENYICEECKTKEIREVSRGDIDKEKLRQGTEIIYAISRESLEDCYLWEELLGWVARGYPNP